MADTNTDAKETSYHLDRLVGDAAEFFPDHPAHVVEAALGAVKGNKVNFTRTEAQKAITQFYDHEVEMSYGAFTGVPGKGGS